ncbi:MAG TPA: prenyltransferase/squalene oxidase repeat-containing protein [Thermomicrobiales bacterium]|nr:prenyltransferase/squalene oxidase repeat-containing protein [Thermomicrobiales bacterium]
MTSLTVGLIGALLLTVTVSGTAAQPATPTGVVAEADLDAAVMWLIAQQLEDGSFPGFSGESDPSMTIDAVLALIAAGLRGEDTAGAVASAMDYLTSGDIAGAYAETGVGQAAKLILTAVATGGDPRDVGGVDALELVVEGQNPETGMYGASIFEHGLALMALAATGTEVPASAIEALEATQGPEGGWAFDTSTEEGAADSNTTAMVVQALVAIGEGESEMAQEAIAFLEETIESEEGALYQPGAAFPPDANSTALVLQAAIAAEQDLESDPWAALQSALAGFQNEDGAFHYSPDDTADNLFATVQAIPAVAGVAFPIVPADSEAIPVASPVTLVPHGMIVRAA